MIPQNEQGVIALFSEHAEALGYKFVSIGTRCPDAILEKDGQRVRVEFELRSINFKKHRHNPDDVDLIICWLDDWDASPVPVLSLEKYILLTTHMDIDTDTTPIYSEPPQLSHWQRFCQWWNQFVERKPCCRHCYSYSLSWRCEYEREATYNEFEDAWQYLGTSYITCNDCGLIRTKNIVYLEHHG